MSESPEALAGSCVRYVREATGVTLDYTQDTLPLLDHYLATIPASSRDEVLQLVIPVCGAYFGEVIRRHFSDARWFIDDKHDHWRIEFSHCFLYFNPIGMALEAIERTAAPGWNAHLSMFDADRAEVEAALSVLGDADEADYYRLGIRYEVIEVAHETLMVRAEPERRFDPEVYAKVAAAERESGNRALG